MRCHRLRPRGKGLSLALAVGLVVSPHLRATAATEDVVTAEDLRAAYPDLPLRQVTMTEFERVTRNPMHLVQLIVTPDSVESVSTTNELPPLAVPPSGYTSAAPASGPSTAPAYTSSAGTSRRRGSQSSYGGSINILGSGDVDSKEAAIVVFVVAGVVVLAAAVIYSGVLVYNLATHPEDAPPVWWEPGVRYLYFSGGSQRGWMSGGYVGVGFSGEDADVGLMIEGGYLDAHVVTIDNNEVSVGGGYAMAGPVVRWALGASEYPYTVEMELLAGGASGYSLISRASAALTWSLEGPWRMGLRLGALYLDVKETEGPVWQAGDDFNLFFGAETGLQF